MAKAVELCVGAELLAEPERGLWCDSCCLPSVISASLATTLNGALWAVMSVQSCTECGR